MSAKLKTRDGEIVFGSNNMPAVTLDENGDLRVILPEGVRVFVFAADSGVRVGAQKLLDGRGLELIAARRAPGPRLREPIRVSQFTCPKCGSHKFGSWQNGDGQMRRHCHGLDGACDFTFHQRDDARYFEEIQKT